MRQREVWLGAWLRVRICGTAKVHASDFTEATCLANCTGAKYATQCNTTASSLTAMRRTATLRPQYSPPCIASPDPGTASGRCGFFATRQDWRLPRHCGE